MTNGKEKNRHRERSPKTPYWMLLPTFILLISMMGYPLINNIYLAFTYNRLLVPTLTGFSGLENFKAVVTNSDLGQIVLNTVCWVGFSVGFQFLLGLGLAMALKKPFFGRTIYQAIVFLPWALSSAVVGLMFRWIFNGEFGPVMDLLLKANIPLFGLNDFLAANRSFLGVPGLSLAVVILAMVWVGIPFFGIMLLAALQSISPDLYEAGDIDGTNAWQRFINITVPCIKPTIIMTVLLRVIWVFNSSDMIYIITGGGPANSSQTLTSLLYMTANKTLDFGMTAALGLIFMALLVGFSLFFIRLTRYEEAGDF